MSKIMLVEDDDNLRNIYADRLMAEGYEIVAARDGEEALAMAVNEKPDLIISDVMMPKISGFDMLDILRSTAETKNTKVIMMTALSQKEDQERGERLGANRYLVKSQVTLEDVVRVAAEVIAEDPDVAVMPKDERPRERTVAEVAAEAQAALNSIASGSTALAAPPLPPVHTTVPTPPAPVAVPSVPQAPPAPLSAPVAMPLPSRPAPAPAPMPVSPPAPSVQDSAPRPAMPAGQKVVEPLSAPVEAKPDINALYQAELEKEQTSVPAAPPVAPVGPPAAPANPSGGINPSDVSI